MSPFFPFGPHTTLAPVGGEEQLPMGAQSIGVLASPPGNVALQPGVPAQAPPAAWEPSKWAIFSEAMSGDGSMHHAADRLRQEHTAQLFAQRLAAERDAAGQGMSPGFKFALDADSGGFAQAMNKNYEPQIVPGGDSRVAGGQMQGMAPKVSVTPQGVGTTQTATGTYNTGQLPTPMTDAEAAKARDEAEKTRQQGLLTPAQILHLDRMGRAAMITANKKPAGGAGGQDVFGAYGLKPGAAN